MPIRPVVYVVPHLLLLLLGCKPPEGGDFDAPFGAEAPAWARDEKLPRWAGDFAFVSENNSGQYPAGIDNSPAVMHIGTDLSVHLTFTRDNGRRASCQGRLDDAPDDVIARVRIPVRCRYEGKGDAPEDLRDETLRLFGNQIIDYTPKWYIWEVDLDRLDVAVSLYSCRNNPSKCAVSAGDGAR